MARSVPANRIEKLVDCATEVFIDQGYRRTQMEDVAAAVGIAKGTLYLYVDSKEALFDLVARFADGPRPLPNPLKLPILRPGLARHFATSVSDYLSIRCRRRS